MWSYQTARLEVEQLVERFASLSDKNRRTYNEAATRQEFILPLFHALGWDTRNAREVAPEEKVSRGRVDFAFRLDGIPRFFLETKKIPEDLSDPRWAKQAITYSWLKGVTWAVLSDFEEVKVFNAEWQEPIPARAIFKDLHWQEYLDRFDDLMLLSREAIREGAIDREAEQVGKKVRKTSVDRKLFEDLANWRHELFRHLRPYNPLWTIEQIDEAVQRILNRLIFIRVVEDRLIEEPRLIPLLREWQDQGHKGDLVRKLSGLFRELDEIYNARLFAPHFSESAECEPAPYIQIIEGLHDLPGGYGFYDFSAIGADVLGTIYEQYLGYVAQDPLATEVVSKWGKRKKQGIYYTPRFVVKYIVQNTLGRMLEEGGLDLALNIKVLDPACGSGSFLIEAFDMLDTFVAHERGEIPGENPEADAARRRYILAHNLYGVDLDAQAVEITRLNLWLRAVNKKGSLPVLDNVRQGNSLIDDSVVGGENAFQWEEEFPEVMRRGGFDVVIGNPPYGIVFDQTEKEYLETAYPAFQRNNDRFVAFIDKSIGLLKTGGAFSFIVPNTFLRGPYFDGLKRRILETTCVVEIVDFGILEVFEDPNVFTAILILQKLKPSLEGRSSQYISVSSLDDFPRHIVLHTLSQSQLQSLNWALSGQLSRRLAEQCVSLEELAFVKDVGLNYWTQGRGKVRGGSIAERVLYEGKRENANDIPYIKGRDIDRYHLEFCNRWVRADYQNRLNPDVDTFRFSPEFLQVEKKLIYRQTSSGLIATIDVNGFLVDKTLHTVIWKNVDNRMALEFLLGLFNSKLFSFLYNDMAQEEDRVFAQVKIFRVKRLPICTINFDDLTDVARHDHMVEMVKQMLSLKQEYAAAEARLEDRRHDLARQIERLDAWIDELVYELYGLSDDEVALVEAHK